MGYGRRDVTAITKKRFRRGAESSRAENGPLRGNGERRHAAIAAAA
jgi:hypothetical protein